ncbi:uncharacterized protein LOC142817709 isoform X2 [Rhipicephalus microplus]|uniref:uncharacterized protein LOC142817709 isoform X2 n=1 Tax=Rhipicephalus microplus TaxID=6941 RepID=UPI003F6C9394
MLSPRNAKRVVPLSTAASWSSSPGVHSPCSSSALSSCLSSCTSTPPSKALMVPHPRWNSTVTRRWPLGLWFELGTLQLQPRPDPSLPHDSAGAGVASGGPTKSRGNGSSHRPLPMSPGRFVGFWSVHNSEIAQRRNYIKYWAMFYEAFGAGWPNRSDAYIRQLAAVERNVFQEFLGVVNNENMEPARFWLSDIGRHTLNLPASRWIEQLGVVTLPVVARNESAYEPNDTLTVTDAMFLRAVNRLFRTHNSTMLLRHLSWFFIQIIRRRLQQGSHAL